MATFKALLLFGQSNCNGETPLASYTATELLQKDKVLIWYRGALSKFKAGENNRNNAVTEQKAGWTTQLAQRIEDDYSGNIILLKVAVGGTGVGASDRWNNAVTGNMTSLLEQTKIQIKALTAFFNKNYPSDMLQWSAVINNMGENDSGNETDSLAFETNFTDTVNDIKTALGNSTLPIYDWEIGDNLVGSGAYRGNVNTAKSNINTAIGNGGELYGTDGSDGYDFLDDFHYDYTSCVLAGNDLYNDLVANGHI